MSDNGDVALICGLIGVILTLLGIAATLSTRDFRGRARRGPGRVVRPRMNQPGGSRGARRNGVAYHPVLRLTTVEGQAVEAESSAVGGPPPARPGERVAIMYGPAVPARGRVDGPLEGGTLVGAVFLGVGLLLIVIGVRLGVPFLMDGLFSPLSRFGPPAGSISR
ncbi:DUF3592 domain-containing protein [Streptosporangium lutulentum]|uniref:DUF3592 domain-containing protein n=1 Tax=Streptosporangium lutulentum TaxID=1461250 RepID=A0ABT9QPA1_9ACTN|nr:DUF3592 domain-containing protein [Streptosporangium lutulentum]MDP9848592.1 hypothetical protein [Streptosporangium lutulentum]